MLRTAASRAVLPNQKRKKTKENTLDWGIKIKTIYFQINELIAGRFERKICWMGFQIFYPSR